MPLNKQFRDLLKELESQGASIKRTKKGYMIYPPDRGKRAVMIHLTPSDRRSWKNMIAELRRSGFDL